MRPVARLGDMTIGNCEEHGEDILGVIVGGAFTALVNGRPVARIGDSVVCRCGHTAKIVTGTLTTRHSKIKIATARLGDLVAVGPYKGVIITGSHDTFVDG